METVSSSEYQSISTRLHYSLQAQLNNTKKYEVNWKQKYIYTARGSQDTR